MKNFLEYTNPIEDEIIEELDVLNPEFDPEVFIKPYAKNALESFSANYAAFNENVKKVDEFLLEFEKVSKITDSLMKKEEMEGIFISHLLLVNENVQQIKSDIKGINEVDMSEIKSYVDFIDNKTEALNELVDSELPKFKQLIIKNDFNLNKKIEEVTNYIQDSAMLVDSLGVLETKIEEVSNIVESLEVLEAKIEDISLSKNKIFEIQLDVDNKIETINESLVANQDIIQEKLDLMNLGINESNISIQLLETKVEDISVSKNKIFEIQLDVNKKIELLSDTLDLNKGEIQETIETLNSSILDSFLETELSIDSKFEGVEVVLANQQKYAKEINSDVTHKFSSLYSEIESTNQLISSLSEKYTDSVFPVLGKIDEFEKNLNSVETVVAEYYSSLDHAKAELKQVVNEVNNIFINDKYIELDNKVVQIEEMFERLSKKELLGEATDIEPNLPFSSPEELKAIAVEKNNQKATSELADKNLKAIQAKMRVLEQSIGRIINAGPGSGEVNLRWLDDVDRSTIDDGLFLRYNATSKKFEFAAVSGGVGGGAAQIQSDWNQTSTGALDYIKNKPEVYTKTEVDAAIAATIVATNRSFVSDSTINQQTLDTFAYTVYGGAKYIIYITVGATKQMCEILLLHDGISVNIVEYANINTSIPLCTFASDILNANVRLLITPTSISTNFKIIRTLIPS